MIRQAILFLLGLQLASAANDIYAFTILANGDNGGKCRAAAKKLGKEVQDMFDDLVPGFTPYDPSGGARFLRATNRALQQLQATSISLDSPDSASTNAIQLCSAKFCNKPVNWDWCLWNGCNCACGARRELARTVNSDDETKVTNAKKQLDDLMVTRGKDYGCTLSVQMTKVV